MSASPSERLIVLATNNAGKATELSALLADLPVRLALIGEVAGAVEIAEPFATFRENAAHKALTAARVSDEWALGEDSGLAVDALAGRPGVYSARFAGQGAPDGERVDLLLRMLEGVPLERRTGRFHCAIALASPDRILGRWEGLCEGRICSQPRGHGGFGFDPVFIPKTEMRTNAELSPEEKNAISHRGIAMRKAAAELPSILSD